VASDLSYLQYLRTGRGPRPEPPARAPAHDRVPPATVGPPPSTC